MAPPRPPVVARARPTTVDDVATVLSSFNMLAWSPPTDVDETPVLQEEPVTATDPVEEAAAVDPVEAAAVVEPVEVAARRLAADGRTVVMVHGLPVDGMTGWRIGPDGRRRATRLRPGGADLVVVARLGRLKIPATPAWEGTVYADGGRPVADWPPGWRPLESGAWDDGHERPPGELPTAPGGVPSPTDTHTVRSRVRLQG